MLELMALGVSVVLIVALVLYARRLRKELNAVWDRTAVNDIHIQHIQEKVGLEVEPTSSREKVKQLLKRFQKKAD